MYKIKFSVTSIIKFSCNQIDLLSISKEIWRLVFTNEQNVDPEIDYENEEEGQYYLLYLNNKLIATAWWRKTDKGIKLEKFALLKVFRNRGLGSI